MTTDAELRERITHLEDRAAIQDCMQRYARGMDRRDRELLRSAYHDGAVDDHVGFIGEVDAFIDWAFAYHSTQARYQHYLLNHSVELNGDEAHAETYYLFVGTDREPANHMTVSGGRYVDRLGAPRRTVGDRRPCLCRGVERESTSLITDEVIAMMAGSMKVARHDRTDPSYDRPLVAARADAPS
jgi:hypothetical protein